MRKVLVIGSGGAGKSTFARRLGESLGLPVVHLDSCYWKPGWVEPPKDVWLKTVEGLLARDEWVMDGNYSDTLNVRLAACDTVIFLDLPRLVCLWGIVSRWLRWRGRTRPDMTAGCPERLTWEFVRWVWTYPAERRPKVLARLRALEARGEKRVLVVRSRREARRLPARLAQESESAAAGAPVD